jgi:hypothetical protein
MENESRVEEQAVARTALLALTVLVTVGALCLGICLLIASRAEAVQSPGRPVKHILPACPSDEGEQIGPCVWIGSVDGNKTGRSFRVRVNPKDHLLPGKVDYIPDWRARMLRGYPYAVSPYGTSGRAS